MVRTRSIPDWQATSASLEENLIEILQTLREERSAGLRPDVICLNAHDALHQYLRFVEQDLGI